MFGSSKRAAARQEAADRAQSAAALRDTYQGKAKTHADAAKRERAELAAGRRATSFPDPAANRAIAEYHEANQRICEDNARQMAQSAEYWAKKAGRRR